MNTAVPVPNESTGKRGMPIVSTKLETDIINNYFKSNSSAGKFIPILPVKNGNIIVFGNYNAIGRRLQKNPYFKLDNESEIRRVKMLNDLNIIQHVITTALNPDNLNLCDPARKEEHLKQINKSIDLLENEIKHLQNSNIKCGNVAMNIANDASRSIIQSLNNATRFDYKNSSLFKEALTKLHNIIYDMINKKLCNKDEFAIADLRKYVVNLYDNLCNGMLNYHINNIGQSIKGITADLYGYDK